MGPELADEPKKGKKKSDGPKKSYRGPREMFGPPKNHLGENIRGGPKFQKTGLVVRHRIAV